MALPQPRLQFDAAACLAWEESPEERHEFIAGEVFLRKSAKGLWVLHPYDPGATVRLAYVDLALPIAAFYEDVEFPPAKAP